MHDEDDMYTLTLTLGLSSDAKSLECSAQLQFK